MKVIDLTHTISETMPVYPGTEQPRLTPANSYEKDGFKETLLSMYSHTGTHVDPPAHLFAGRTTLDAFPVSQFVGRAVVIDCRHIKEGEAITMQEIAPRRADAEKADYLLFNLGWDARWGTEEYYGDYPCQYPRVNLVKSYSGVLKFESYDTTYDENWNPTYSWEPIADATVTVGDNKYTTDSNGIVTVDTSKLSYFNNVQIERKSSSDAPNVCRLDGSFGFYFNDINQDGKVNINDATRLQKHLVNKDSLDDKGLSVSDVNLDGEINVRDVTALQKILAEIG